IADNLIGKKVKCSCGQVFVAQGDKSATQSDSESTSIDKVLVACSECGAKLKVGSTSLGKKMKCPKCAAVFVAAVEAPSSIRDNDEARPVYPSRTLLNVLVGLMIVAFLLVVMAIWFGDYIGKDLLGMKGGLHADLIGIPKPPVTNENVEFDKAKLEKLVAKER